MQIPDCTADGMFVNWKKRNGTLRGCIGSLTKMPLNRLKDYAAKAAFDDDRFPPIGLSELNDLVGVVSILHSFEECCTITDWEIGKHGVIVQFTEGSNLFRSTFLPEVAHEQHWSREETILHAVKKSGFNGSFERIRRNIIVTRYQSSTASLTYEEYAQALN
jgi:uncharacterized protein (TIGR00296 family)